MTGSDPPRCPALRLHETGFSGRVKPVGKRVVGASVLSVRSQEQHVPGLENLHNDKPGGTGVHPDTGV